jgi:hypothetical protein
MARGNPDLRGYLATIEDDFDRAHVLGVEPPTRYSVEGMLSRMMVKGYITDLPSVEQTFRSIGSRIHLLAADKCMFPRQPRYVIPRGEQPNYGLVTTTTHEAFEKWTQERRWPAYRYYVSPEDNLERLKTTGFLQSYEDQVPGRAIHTDKELSLYLDPTSPMSDQMHQGQATSADQHPYH